MYLHIKTVTNEKRIEGGCGYPPCRKKLDELLQFTVVEEVDGKHSRKTELTLFCSARCYENNLRDHT